MLLSHSPSSKEQEQKTGRNKDREIALQLLSQTARSLDKRELCNKEKLFFSQVGASTALIWLLTAAHGEPTWVSLFASTVFTFYSRYPIALAFLCTKWRYQWVRFLLSCFCSLLWLCSEYPACPQRGSRGASQLCFLVGEMRSSQCPASSAVSVQMCTGQKHRWWSVCNCLLQPHHTAVRSSKMTSW